MPAALASTTFDLYANLVWTRASTSSSSHAFPQWSHSLGSCGFHLGLSLSEEGLVEWVVVPPADLEARVGSKTSHLSFSFFFLMFESCTYCSPESKHF